ncbi:MAG: FAD-binding protein [Solirubrobacteraceae bacterium]
MNVVWRGEPGYEEARVGRIFNARRPERFPAAVVLAEDERDVAAGVRLARERGLRVSVRAGGHSWAAWSLRDDALLIDLGAMREMTFDPATGIATASPGLKGSGRASSPTALRRTGRAPAGVPRPEQTRTTGAP